MYDELYSDTAVYLDVEDVINAVGNDFHVQSANQMVGFTSVSEYSDLVKCNDLCAIIDSHQHAMTDNGGVIIMADNPKKAILEYAKDLSNQGYPLNQGAITWVQYA